MGSLVVVTILKEHGAGSDKMYNVSEDGDEYKFKEYGAGGDYKHKDPGAGGEILRGYSR